jgi:peptidoglycan/LPS O-acetylase OafA/YrhL
MLNSDRYSGADKPESGAESRNLDILRATAVLLVYFAHVRQFVVEMPFHLYQIGRFGVLLFFVHTCLVLLYSLERSSHSPGIATLNFYVRRVFRIYPLAILAVCIVLLAHIPRTPDSNYQTLTHKEIVSSLALVGNLTDSNEALLVMWSLPWEIQMYLILPLLFYGLGRRGVWSGLALWLAAVVVYIVFRVKLIVYAPYFLAGLIAYQFMHRPRLFRLPAWLWPVMLALVTVLYSAAWRSRPPLPLFGADLCSLLLGLSIPLFREPSESFLTRASHLIAKYSYGIYLSHTPIMWLTFVRMANAPLAVRTALLIGSSAGVPYVLYHVVEHPFIQFGIKQGNSLCRRLASQSSPVSGALSKTATP